MKGKEVGGRERRRWGRVKRNKNLTRVEGGGGGGRG